jgi:chromosome segregation ATPase
MDLVALTRENQVLNGEMQQVCSLRDQLQSEVQECDRQITQLNEFVRGKDEEKHQLLVNYRKLIGEHERLDIQYRTQIEEVSGLRLEIVSRDKRIQALETQMDVLNSEMNKYKIDVTAHEKQHGTLSRALATCERHIKQLETEKQRMLREVQSAREVVHTVDRSKDGLQAQLVQMSVEHEKLSQQVNQLLVEREALEKRVQTEQLKSERFEMLLNTERTKQIQHEKSQMGIQMSRTMLEQQVVQLQEEQQYALSTTKLQLEESKKQTELFRTRVTELETLVSEQNTELVRTRQALQDQQEKLDRLDTELQEKRRVIQELVHTSDSVSMKILKEMEETQRQYQETSERLRHSRGTSVDSIASHGTTGNHDGT